MLGGNSLGHFNEQSCGRKVERVGKSGDEDPADQPKKKKLGKSAHLKPSFKDEKGDRQK